MYKILAVDDEKYILRIVKMVLQKNGYEILTAVNGEEALTLIFEEKPDLVLLDFMMPGINGLEVLIKIRENSQFTDLPVIFLTARDLSPEVKKQIEKNRAAYLYKPFTETALVRAISGCLDCKPGN